MEQTKKMYKKSDITKAITAYDAKKHYKQTLSLESAQIENTNTWLITLLPERTNEKGTPLIVSAGKPSKKGWSSNLSAGLELRISLPVPAKHSLTCLNKKADSKPPVLLYDIYTLENGGLNLTDFVTHIKALRLSWIPRLFWRGGRSLDILSQT